MDVLEGEKLGLAEAASRLGLSWAQAWRLLLTGRLKGVKMNGRWQVSAESVARELVRRSREVSGVRIV